MEAGQPCLCWAPQFIGNLIKDDGEISFVNKRRKKESKESSFHAIHAGGMAGKLPERF